VQQRNSIVQKYVQQSILTLQNHVHAVLNVFVIMLTV